MCILWASAIESLTKELYQITEGTSMEDFQRKKQLKWSVHATQRKTDIINNSDIPKFLKYKAKKEASI